MMTYHITVKTVDEAISIVTLHLDEMAGKCAISAERSTGKERQLKTGESSGLRQAANFVRNLKIELAP